MIHNLNLNNLSDLLSEHIMKFKLNTEYPKIPNSWYHLGEYANKLENINTELMHSMTTSDIKEVVSTIELLMTISTRAMVIARNIFSHIGVRRCENRKCCLTWYMNLKAIENLFSAYVKDLENM